MNHFIVGFAVVLFLVLVVGGIVLLILNLTKCDDKTQFINDMKSIKLPEAMSNITGSNHLTDTFINTVYDNNEALIKKVYCNKETKSLFQNIIKGNNVNKKKCFEELAIYDLVKTFQTIVNKTSDLHPNAVKFLIASIICAIVDLYKHQNRSYPSMDLFCKLIACGSPKSIWLTSEGTDVGGVRHILTKNDLISKNIGTKDNFQHPMTLFKFLISKNVTLNMQNLHDGFNAPVNDFLQNHVQDFLGRDCFNTKVSQTDQNNIISLLNSVSKELVKELLQKMFPNNLGPGGKFNPSHFFPPSGFGPHGKHYPSGKTSNLGPGGEYHPHNLGPGGKQKHSSGILPGPIGPQMPPF